MAHWFGLATVVICIISFLPYISDTLSHKTKPERASWIIWTVLGSIAFFSQLAKGATNSLWLPGIQTFGDLLIFLLAIKFGVGGFTRRDTIALGVAGMGLLLWFFTKEAAFALFLVIGIDGVGSVVTIIKSYEAPESETIISWALFSLSGLVAFLAVDSWNPILLVYPVYIFLINIAVIVAIYLGKKKMGKNLL